MNYSIDIVKQVLKYKIKHSQEVSYFSNNDNVSATLLVCVEGANKKDILPFYVVGVSSVKEYYDNLMISLLSLSRLDNLAYMNMLKSYNYSQHYNIIKLFKFLIDNDLNLAYVKVYILKKSKKQNQEYLRDEIYFSSAYQDAVFGLNSSVIYRMKQYNLNSLKNSLKLIQYEFLNLHRNIYNGYNKFNLNQYYPEYTDMIDIISNFKIESETKKHLKQFFLDNRLSSENNSSVSNKNGIVFNYLINILKIDTPFNMYCFKLPFSFNRTPDYYDDDSVSNTLYLKVVTNRHNSKTSQIIYLDYTYNKYNFLRACDTYYSQHYIKSDISKIYNYKYLMYQKNGEINHLKDYFKLLKRTTLKVKNSRGLFEEKFLDTFIEPSVEYYDFINEQDYLEKYHENLLTVLNKLVKNAPHVDALYLNSNVSLAILISILDKNKIDKEHPFYKLLEKAYKNEIIFKKLFW